MVHKYFFEEKSDGKKLDNTDFIRNLSSKKFQTYEKPLYCQLGKINYFDAEIKGKKRHFSGFWDQVGDYLSVDSKTPKFEAIWLVHKFVVESGTMKCGN